MKSTKKALFTSALSLLLCVSMLVGTTFAWFTDSVTSGVNQIIAGNLDVDVLHTSAKVTEPASIAGDTALFRDVNGNEMLWEPGAVSYENFSVKNVGTLAFKYNMSLNITDYNAVKDTTFTLKDVLKVKVLTGDRMLSAVTRDAVAALDWDTTDTLDAFRKDGGKLYPAGTEHKDSAEDFQVIVYWAPTDSDNNWNVNNGKTTTDGKHLYIKFGINVVATQLDYEGDSFGPDYDENLLLPNMPTSINKAFESAPISGIGAPASESVRIVNKNNDTIAATVPATAVNNIVGAAAAKAADIDNTKDVSTVLYLNVETTSVGAGSATYNIDLTAVMSYTDLDGNTKQAELNAAEVDGALGGQIVAANVNIGSGLTDVTVKHNGTPMTALSSAAEDAAGYFYNEGTGALTIKTSSFSPFEVEYKIAKAAATVTFTDGTVVEAASLSSAVKLAKPGDTIHLLEDTVIDGILANDTYTRKSGTFPALKGLTIDGNGHKITVPASMKELTDAMYQTTLKNCSIVFMGGGGNTISLYASNSVYDHVDVYGTSAYSNNTGAFANYVMDDSSVTLKNCTSYMDVNGSSYNGVFIGYPNTSGTLTFENCVNKGNFVSAGAGMFFGNPTYAHYTVNIINCRNEGIIRQTTINNTSYLHNPIFGITSDSAGGKTINIDGTTYTNYFQQYARMDIPFTHFGSGFSCGPEDSSFAVSKDANGVITITPAAEASVAYYVVIVGNQARIVAGGSSQICFSEKVVPASDGSLTVNLNGNYQFVDNTWVADHPDAVRSELTVVGENGTDVTYSIYTLDGVSYYALDDDTVDYSTHEPAENYRLVAYAYNANGQLLSSVGNFFKN